MMLGRIHDAISEIATGKRPSMIFTLSFVILTLILWAAVFPLDIASYAQGQVEPAGQLKRIQHLEGGIIREIKVQEGQPVAAGTVIAELEDVSSNADVGDFNARVASHEIKVHRLNASLARVDAISFPSNLESGFPALVAEGRSAFHAYRERYKAMVQNHESRMAQRRSEIEEAKERLAGLQTRSKIVSEQVDISAVMLKQKLTHEYEHLSLKKEQAQIDADRNATIATWQRAQTGLAEATAALAAFRSDEEFSLRKELSDTRTELSSLRERIKKPSDSRDRTVVRAPVSGTIMMLYFKNKGGVVSPGGTLATLVPDGEALLVDAKLPITEIGYVHIGAPARLTIASGGPGFAPIEATVVHISPDAVFDEKTGLGYYVVRLEPKELAFRRGSDAYALRPGVQVLAAILTGQRSVLTLLLEPFWGNGIKPLTER